MTATTPPASPTICELKLRRQYTLRYVIALTCVGATILVGAFQLHRILEINENQADIINIAGAQRMLSQRLALLTPRAVDGDSQADRDRACADLTVALERMQNSHHYLTTLQPDGVIPSQVSAELRAHYGNGGVGLSARVEDFLQSFKVFLDDPQGRAEDIDQYRILAETSLLADLDQAVSLHVEAARGTVLRAIQVHGLWVIGALLLLLLEVVVIFRPMARSAARIVSDMSAELEERSATLSRSMQVAKMGHSRATNEAADPLWISRELAVLYGLDVEEGLIPLSLIQHRDVYDPDQPESNTVHVAFKRTWRTGKASEARGRFRKPDGTIIDISADTVAQCDHTGKVIAVEGVVRDITEEAEAARQLSKSIQVNEYQRHDLIGAQRIANMANWRRWVDSDCFEWDDRTYELLKLDKDQFSPTLKNVRHLYCSNGFNKVSAMQLQAAEKGIGQAVDVQMTRGDGAVVDIRIRSTMEVDEDGDPKALFGTIQDITAEKDAERELEQLAYYDPLTGLANRTLFNRKLEQACENAKSGKVAGGRKAALLLIDLDHFKEVNDGLGHAAGDELLAIIAKRLSKKIDGEHFVGRLGGDEFAIITSASSSALDGLCQDIIESVGQSVRLTQGEVQVGASIGIAIAPQDSCEPDELMRVADLALYTSKENGRGRATYFEQSMSDTIGQRLSLAKEVRQALEGGRFEAHFQPLVSMADGKVCGFETLLRLPHPERGYIPPSEFIPIAESSHLIADLGAFVLNEACSQAQSWIDAGLPPRPVSVNVSAAQIWHGDLEQIIDQALASSGLDPKLLCIELTESVFASDSIKRLKGILTRLNERGISLALDDFGTGYSSLSYLNQLPFDKLKIDRAFVANVDACASRRKLLQGIVSLGHGLGMEVVAEGVETMEELEIIRELGCQTVQGWYYGRAQKSAEAITEAARIDGLETLTPILKQIAVSEEAPEDNIQDNLAGAA